MNNKAKATDMKEDGKPALVPKLRFPEFREAVGWPQQQLGNVATFFKGKGLPKSALIPDGKSPCIHYGELFTEYPEVIGAVRSRTNLEENVFLSVENDVLMPTSDVTPRGLAKACYLNFENVILGGDILVIRTNKRSVSGEFLARYIRHLEIKVLQLVSGSTVFHLYATSMEKLALSFPRDRAEQQKIAECLSSLDELIAALARKVDALKTHKKGLMQQLFPREGETQPRLRFPEFRDAGEWNVDGLQTMADFVNEKISVELVALKNYVSTENILANYGGIDSASKLPTTGSVTRFKPNDILVSNIRPYLKKVWTADKEGGASNDVIVVRAKSKLLPQYLSALLKNDVFIDYVMTGAKGVKMPRGDVDSIKTYPALYPCKTEQHRIADCLTSLDNLITAQTQELETLKTHKKGLMQQLFPSAEALEA